MNRFILHGCMRLAPIQPPFRPVLCHTYPPLPSSIVSSYITVHAHIYVLYASNSIREAKYLADGEYVDADAQQGDGDGDDVDDEEDGGGGHETWAEDAVEH